MGTFNDLPELNNDEKMTVFRPTTVGDVFRDLARHPGRYFIQQWNWKSALLSSLARGSIFFSVNLGAGLDAASAAMITEIVYRVTAAGAYGSLTQAFRHVEPFWKGVVCTMILLPAVSHTMELIIHYFRGTQRLGWSILVSVCFTACTTSFNVFAMRRGILVVDGSNASLLDDFRALPRVFAAFLCCLCAPLKQLTQFISARIAQCYK